MSPRIRWGEQTSMFPPQPVPAHLRSDLERLYKGSDLMYSEARRIVASAHLAGLRFPSGLAIVLWNLERDLDQLAYLLNPDRLALSAQDPPGRNDSQDDTTQPEAPAQDRREAAPG